jgi:hypothetical protein
MPNATRSPRADGATRKTRPTASAPKVAEVVRTTRLEVVDGAGRVRASIGGPDDLFGLTIHGEDGTERVLLHFTDDGNNPALHFCNREGNVVASFGMIDDVDLYRQRVLLGLNDPASQVCLMDFGVQNDESWLTIGHGGRPHVGLSADARGSSVDVSSDGENVAFSFGAERPPEDDRTERTVEERLEAVEAQAERIENKLTVLLSRVTTAQE